MKNNKINLKWSAFFLVLLFWGQAYAGTPAYAQTTLEITATPEVFNEPGAKLLITEVNFKNKTADWVELYYESPTGKPFNLNNFQFKDDNIFKKIEVDYWLTSNEYYLLQFKTDDPDNQSARVLNTTRTGLTSTTEQIILLDPNGKVMDAMCWASATPTADEIKDTDELFQEEGWVSANVSSCFDSAKISTNQSLIRTNLKDTDSMNDWSVTDDITPGQGNDTIAVSPAQNQNSTNLSQSLSTQTPTSSSSSSAPAPTAGSASTQQTSTSTTSKTSSATTSSGTSKKTSGAKKTQPKSTTSTSTSTKKSTSKSAKPKYKNGDLSQNIIISEIFPHAATDDRTNEWIELTNTGDEDVNLGNWQVDDQEGGSKPYIIPDTVTLGAQSSLLIKAPDSKLSLSNAKDSVRLFDPTGKLLQTVEYEEAPKEQSYAWINIIQDNNPASAQWLWENNPTPGEPNPEYLELTGTITNDPDFGETYSFPLQTADGNEYNIIFEESLIAGPLAKATFLKGTTIKILAVAAQNQPAQNAENSTLQIAYVPTRSLFLKKYEITEMPQTSQPSGQQSLPWYLLGLLPPGGAGFWYAFKKIKKNVLK